MKKILIILLCMIGYQSYADIPTGGWVWSPSWNFKELTTTKRNVNTLGLDNGHYCHVRYPFSTPGIKGYAVWTTYTTGTTQSSDAWTLRFTDNFATEDIATEASETTPPWIKYNGVSTSSTVAIGTDWISNKEIYGQGSTDSFGNQQFSGAFNGSFSLFFVWDDEFPQTRGGNSNRYILQEYTGGYISDLAEYLLNETQSIALSYMPLVDLDWTLQNIDTDASYEFWCNNSKYYSGGASDKTSLIDLGDEHTYYDIEDDLTHQEDIQRIIDSDVSWWWDAEDSVAVNWVAEYLLECPITYTGDHWIADLLEFEVPSFDLIAFSTPAFEPFAPIQCFPFVILHNVDTYLGIVSGKNNFMSMEWKTDLYEPIETGMSIPFKGGDIILGLLIIGLIGSVIPLALRVAENVNEKQSIMIIKPNNKK